MGSGSMGTEATTHEWVTGVARDGLAGLEGFDPDAVPLTDVPSVIRLFTVIERIGATGRMLVARRAAEAQLHRAEGERSAADWLATLMGAPVGKAIDELKTSQEIGEHPDVDAAARNAELSQGQLSEIA
ncbi:MAG TPA: hypothetical protein VMY34_10790, partial [Acidimicrobiales bacterium]|nr:hypothetical protein [Acidimicrobiales bacterium]